MSRPFLNAVGVFALVAALTVGMSSTAEASGNDNLGGKLVFTGGFGLTTPCGPEGLNTNGVTVTIGVAANITKHHEDVNIQIKFTGTAQGDQGGTYDISGSATASYSTVNNLGFTYTFPARLDVDGTNGTPGFSSLLNLQLLVDQNQAPVRLFFGSFGSTCDVS